MKANTSNIRRSVIFILVFLLCELNLNAQITTRVNGVELSYSDNHKMVIRIPKKLVTYGKKSGYSTSIKISKVIEGDFNNTDSVSVYKIFDKKYYVFENNTDELLEVSESIRVYDDNDKHDIAFDKIIDVDDGNVYIFDNVTKGKYFLTVEKICDKNIEETKNNFIIIK